jgi:flagellar biogenesis protein FliO
LSLTPQHSLHLVRVADRTLLVGLSPQGCNLLESGPSAAALERQ